MISAEQIKTLREKTGAGISDIKKALEESGGDMQRAAEVIERRMASVAVKKAGRETNACVVDAYIHSNGKVGTLIELRCETDFVARNPAFRALAHDIAMHVAAMSPLYLSLESVAQDVWHAEKARCEKEERNMNKSVAIAQEIVDGKLKAYFGARALLSQPFVKDQDKTVGEVINEAIGKFGENISLIRFIRFEL